MRTAIAIVLLLTSGLVKSQLDTTATTEPEKPLRFVEEMPEYPGGEQELMIFLANNIQYPDAAREDSIQGTVYAEFVIGSDGRVGDIRILRGLGYGCDEEVIRVLEMMPRWKPGMQTGVPVPVYYNLPVVFKLNRW